MRKLLIALALALAGCGGHAAPSASTTSATATRSTAATTTRCSPFDYAMPCALLDLPRAGVTSSAVLPSRVYATGIDFAWSCPNPTSARDFGASYLSPDITKNWTFNCVSWWHNAHRSTVDVFESSATRAGQGCAAGRADALLAARQAAGIGNTTRPIDFAIDYQANPPTLAPYFICVKQVLGAREGAYGGYYQVKYLCDHGLVNHTNWQTYAWSNGQWLPASCAPLEQYLNSTSVDFDRAIAPDYGQSPAPAVNCQDKNLGEFPLPCGDPFRILSKNKWHLAGGVLASEYNTATTWRHFGCKNPVRRQVCKSTRYHLQLLDGRLHGLHDQRVFGRRARERLLEGLLKAR